MSNQTLWNEGAGRIQEGRPDWIGAVPHFGPSNPDEQYADRITRRDDVWDRMATVAGSRVPVFMVADLENEGESVADIQRRFPHLTRADIHSALSYAHGFEGIIAQERARYWRAVGQYKPR